MTQEQVDFTEDQHRLWGALHERLWPRIEAHACQEYLEGAGLLALPRDRIPTVDELNGAITPRTGWRVERTAVRYSDAKDWYAKFATRTFLVTDYMRSWEEIDWTPEPDMWHDIFGHLPFMTLPAYAALEDLYAPAFLAARTDAQRDHVKRLAWFSTEFGLVRQGGQRKLFGAGLISGGSELENVMAGRIEVQPFTIENVIQHDKAVWEQNAILFEFESLAALVAELRRYFDPLVAGRDPELRP